MKVSNSSEPLRMSVTPRAEPPVAPATRMAHLGTLAKFMILRPMARDMFAVALLAVPLWLCGCVAGDVSHRDDGKRAAAIGGAKESGLYEVRVNEATQRLIREHPEMSRKEAYRQARASVPADISNTETAAERKKRLNAEVQDKFEDDLAKLDK